MRLRTLPALVAATALVAGGLVVTAAPAQATETGLSATASSLWQTNNSVRAMAYANGRIYVGGEFTSVRPPGSAAGTNEVARTYLAAFDSTTGALISTWNPVLNGRVWALAVSPDGSKVYAGGDFTSVNGSSRGRLASFSTATGALDTTFKASAAYRVSKLAASGANLYLVGSFGAVNGVVRNRAAAVNATTGALLPFDPNVTSDPLAAIPTPPDVVALAVSPDGSKVYLGGRFTTVGGLPNYGMAAVDATTGAPLSFPAQSAVPTPSPGCVSGVRVIITDGDTLYAGAAGDGGGCFDGTFAANISDGSLKWRNNCLGATEALAVVKGWLFKGSHAHDCSSEGSFPQSGNHFLLVEKLSDGAIGPWYPQTNAAGSTVVGPLIMATDGSQLFVGGDFTTVNGAGQQGMTRFASTPETAPVKPRTPAVASPQRGVVKVTFRATTDLDDENLTYTLYRTGSSTPLGTWKLRSTFWILPTVQYVDSGLTPGTQVSYRVEASDGVATVASATSANVTVASATAAYPVVVASDAPNNYWRFNETTGTTAADTGLSPSAGTYTGVALGRPGALTDAADLSTTAAGFDGSTSSVSTATSGLGLQTFSVEAWIRTTTTTGGKIIGFGDSQTGISGSYDRHIYMGDDGRLMFGVYNGNTNIVRSTRAFNDGQWHHVVGTFEPGSQAFYVDGALQGTASTSSAQGFSGWWKIGNDNLNGWPYQPSSTAFQGDIDEVAVYPWALPIDAVKTHFLAGGGNLLPVPSFTSSCVLLACSLDASASTDDGSIASYAWSFGDGATATGATATHTYATYGKYTVSLTVTDNRGATNTLTRAVAARTTPPADGYGKAVAADDPDIYWRLDEAGGTTAHDLGLTHDDGSITGGVTLGQPGALVGYPGTAAAFASGNVVSGNQIAGPTVYSEEAWFKTTATSGGKILSFGDAQFGGSSNYDRHVYLTPGGNIAFGVWTGFTNIITSPGTYNDGQWHHVVATQGASGMALYLDGAQVGTDPQTDAQDYSGYWRVGGDSPWDGAYSFPGSIDEVAFYSTTLPANRVLAHYLAGRPASVPVASDDSASTAFQTPVSQAAPGVLGNDSGSGLSVTAHTNPAHGTVSIAADGSFTYTPAAGFAGNDSFTYTVTDAASQTSTATVTIAVAAPPVPVANGDSVSTALQTPVSVPAASGLLSNDVGTGLIVQSITQAAHGSVSATANGAFTYTPTGLFVGSDSFTYTVKDVLNRTSTATVSVTVTAPPAPSVTDDSVTTAYQTAANGNVLSNDSGTSLSVTSSTAPSHGTAPVAPGGAFTYTPAAGYSGPDSFTYTVTDILGRTATGTVNVTVGAPPAAPNAVTDTVSTAYQTAASGNVLTNDSGTSITVTGSTQPSHGTATVAPGGAFTYTPAAGYSGPDSFTYTITDSLARTATGTVNVTVGAPPAAPSAVTDTLSTAYQTAASGNVLTNDSGTGITVTGSTQPSHGTATVAPGGAFTYTPAAGYSGPDSFTYTITDSLARTSTGTVNVTVGAPGGLVLVDDSFTRTVAGGWGSAPTGGPWGPNNAALSVNGSAGLFTLAKGQSRSVFSTGAGAVRDVTATATFSLDALPTGSGQFNSISLRRASTSVLTEYRGAVRVQSTGKVSVLIYRLVSGSPDAIVGPETVVPGITAAPGGQLSFRFSAIGASPTTLALTVWKTGTPEPATPTLTTTDSAAALQGAGLLGITDLLSGSATVGAVARFDAFIASRPA